LNSNPPAVLVVYVCRTVLRCSTRRRWWTSGSWRLPDCSPRWTASCSRTLTVWPRMTDYWWDVTLDHITTPSFSADGDTSRSTYFLIYLLISLLLQSRSVA